MTSHATVIAALSSLDDRGLHISRARRREISMLYDQAIRNEPPVFVHMRSYPWTGPPVWSRVRNVSSPNFFFWEYWAANGPINTPWLKVPREAWTFGGSAWDGLAGLKNFDKIYPNAPRSHPGDVEGFLRYLGWKRGMLSPLHPDFFDEDVTVKGKANPGPTFMSHGINSKDKAVEVAVVWLRDVLDGTLAISDIPPIMWSMGGRGKPQTIDKVNSRLDERTQAGRAVWMADAHESVFSWRYQNPLTQYIGMAEDRIDIGFDKFREAKSGSLKKAFTDGNAWISGDWKNFDANIPPCLIHMAFNVIRHVYGINGGSVDADILEFIEDAFIRSHIVCPDRLVRVTTGGIPSGSGFTAIIDSLVNLFVIWRTSNLWSHRPQNEDTSVLYRRVMGDDNLITLHVLSGDGAYCARRARDFLEFMRYIGKRDYGMILHPDKSKVSSYPYVKYAVAKIFEKVPDHSRAYLRKHPPLSINADGVYAQPGLKAMHITKEWEVVQHSRECYSRRWNYLFSGAVCYLSTYFTSDGEPIRPMSEVLARLGSTSAEVRDVIVWRSLLVQYLAEYWANLPARMNLLSMYLDSFYMEKEGIYTSDEAVVSLDALLNGEKTYASRRYVLRKRGKRSPDPGLSCRLWWVACADWWPKTSDHRFSWIREAIRGLYGVVFRLWGRAGLTHDDIGRLRPVFLLEGVKKGYQLAGDLRRRISPIMHDWVVALGMAQRELTVPYRIDWSGYGRPRVAADYVRLGHCVRSFINMPWHYEHPWTLAGVHFSVTLPDLLNNGWLTADVPAVHDGVQLAR